MAEWVNVNKALERWKQDGSPHIEFQQEEVVETTDPYAWASMLSHDLMDICPLKAAYDIAYKYRPDLFPDVTEIPVSASLQKLYDEAIRQEMMIAQAIAYSHENVSYNRKIDQVGKPDIVVDNQILEVKYTSKDDIPYKWIYQIASYMDALSMDKGQIVSVSRIDGNVRCQRVIRNNNTFRAGKKSITLEQLYDTRDRVLFLINSIIREEEVHPPFDSPVFFDNGIAITSHCLYIRDSEERIYFQCHGIAKSGERCKMIVSDDPLCDFHKNQVITREIEWRDPHIRARKNCAWFHRCWGDKTKFGSVEL